MLNLKTNCPCGSGQDYAVCCQPFHLKKAKPNTAEALMRSRFSAYFLGRKQSGLSGYLLESWCPTTRPSQLDLSDQPCWTALKIHHTQAGQSADKHGVVEFSAFYVEGLFQAEFREKSYFQRNAVGFWCYLNGDIVSE